MVLYTTLAEERGTAKAPPIRTPVRFLLDIPRNASFIVFLLQIVMKTKGMNVTTLHIIEKLTFGLSSCPILVCKQLRFWLLLVSELQMSKAIFVKFTSEFNLGRKASQNRATSARYRAKEEWVMVPKIAVVS